MIIHIDSHKEDSIPIKATFVHNHVFIQIFFSVNGHKTIKMNVIFMFIFHIDYLKSKKRVWTVRITDTTQNAQREGSGEMNLFCLYRLECSVPEIEADDSEVQGHLC